MPLGRRAAAAAALHRLAQALVLRQDVRADGVHDVLGVALDDRHRALDPLHDPALLARLDERGEAAVAEALDDQGRVRQRRQPAGGAALDPHVDGREVLAQQGAEVLAQPR